MLAGVLGDATGPFIFWKMWVARQFCRPIARQAIRVCIAQQRVMQKALANRLRSWGRV